MPYEKKRVRLVIAELFVVIISIIIEEKYLPHRIELLHFSIRKKNR